MRRNSRRAPACRRSFSRDRSIRASRTRRCSVRRRSIIVGPFYKTEFYANYGEGFHSTDARGAVLRFSTAELADNDGFVQAASIPLLVKSRGAEIGARTKFIEGLDSSISLFWLNLESENQFVGDSGTTIFGRPSRRYGLEFANKYAPNSWIRFDGDVALVQARYRGVDVAQTLAWLDLITPDALPYGTFLGNAPGNYLPNAIAVTAMGGLELGEATGWFGALKYRYFGARALNRGRLFQFAGDRHVERATGLSMGGRLAAAGRRLQYFQLALRPDHICIWLAPAERPSLRAMRRRRRSRPGLRRRRHGPPSQAARARSCARDAERAAQFRRFARRSA